MSQTKAIEEISTFADTIESHQLDLWNEVQPFREGQTTAAEASANIDRIARDIIGAGETVKDFAHKLKTEGDHA